MIAFDIRTGFGFDIEANDTICHVVGDADGRFMASFNGLIIKVPFLSIYIGTFEEFDEEVLKQTD